MLLYDSAVLLSVGEICPCQFSPAKKPFSTTGSFESPIYSRPKSHDPSLSSTEKTGRFDASNLRFDLCRRLGP